jgi:tetratricopeptide (TPR) repeat protein
MRDALDSWHIGRVLLAYRSHPHHRRVLSQELVSSWLNVTQAQLSRIEKGPAPQDLGKLIYWAQALGIPASLLWFKLPSQRRSVQMVAESENPPPTEILADVLAEPDIFDRPTIGISAFKGMTLQESGERLLKIFLHLDNELGGDSLYQPLSRYVARMAVNVHENPTDGLPAFGQLNQMAGWLALDANYHRAAKGYFTAAIHVGHEVDEPELSASALAYMSLQETYRGRLGTALSLAQTALAINPQRLTPLARTTLGTRLARAHAGLNNDTECLRVLETVRNDFRQAGSRAEPHYLSYVDSIEVAAQQGACYLDLGMSAEAKNALSQAIDLLQTHDPNRVRDHVHYLSRMARCYLLDGEVEQACQTGRNALALGQAIGSTRIFERLKELDSALDPYGHIQCVQEFKDLIRLADAGERSRTYHQ